ncbi:YbhB/YbcL family Raf kinase inhibitor-like protein [Candidatus Peregrinibacteria bacterium]|nr:YbhB/YbcL family Raf kinase inhibitor-like protein [Candidatus Peregrinibacteria bacterium]
MNMEISSPTFTHNGSIPSQYTCDGDDRSPPLRISGVPRGAKSLALIHDDPDAPMGTWVHWLLWNINPLTEEIEENGVPPGATEGMTSWGNTGYGGPCPPSGTHRYLFKLYALDTILDLPSSADMTKLEEATEGHILAKAELIGLYSRRQ